MIGYHGNLGLNRNMLIFLQTIQLGASSYGVQILFHFSAYPSLVDGRLNFGPSKKFLGCDGAGCINTFELLQEMNLRSPSRQQSRWPRSTERKRWSWITYPGVNW